MLRRYGVLRVCAAMTLFAVIISASTTIAILYFVEGRIAITGLLISIFIPLLMAPISTYNNFSLVYRLDQAEEQLRRLSQTDELTKVFNRRYFMEIAGQEFERAKRYHSTFSIAIMDFDNFKSINDGHSHLAGDAALKHVARISLENLRHLDVFARYGGDEFVFLFPETSAAQAKGCIDRILQSVHAVGFQFNNASIPISLSVGIAAFHETMSDYDEILREADFALYSAKRQGGMQVVAHQE